MAGYSRKRRVRPNRLPVCQAARDGQETFVIREVSYSECAHMVHTERADWVEDADGNVIGIQLRVHKDIPERYRGFPEPFGGSTKVVPQVSSVVLSKDEVELITNHPRRWKDKTETRRVRLLRSDQAQTTLELARRKMAAFRPKFAA